MLEIISTLEMISPRTSTADIMEWSPGEWAPIIVLNQESVDQLNAMMRAGWNIGRGDGRLPLLLFPRRLSQMTGLPSDVHARLERDGLEEMVVAILTRPSEPREQLALLTTLPGETMDYAYVSDRVRRSHPGWRGVVSISLGQRSVLTILERGSCQ